MLVYVVMVIWRVIYKNVIVEEFIVVIMWFFIYNKVDVNVIIYVKRNYLL